MSSIISPPTGVIYPDSDGQPMADNTLQFRWIVTLQGGLDALFVDDPNVFVAGDLLWYPVEGDPTIRQAPDVLVAFGRPKGYRGSYRQWEEGGVAPQVVFEVLSPGNRYGEMLRKFDFYERHGVEEYYIFDPDPPDLLGWLRAGRGLQEVPRMEGWQSPRLQVRFNLSSGDLIVTAPSGRPFASYLDLIAQRDEEARRRWEAERRSKEAEQAAEALRAQLRALGVEPNQ